MAKTVAADGFGRSVRALRGALFGSSAFLAASCVTGSPVVERSARHPVPQTQAASAQSPRSITVVLLAVDGVRWQDVFRGVDPDLAEAQRLEAGDRLRAEALMPNLHGLAESGGMLVGAPDSGTGVFASGPELVSLPGYTEILSGRRIHGCRDNACGAITRPTLADELASFPGIRPEEVAVVTSWPDIGRIAAQRPDRIAMTTGKNGGPTRALFRKDPVAAALLDEGARASSEPGAGDFRPDEHTARIALRYLEQAHPRFLFVSLGEPDEYAHRGDYAGYLRALRHADLAIGQISRVLDERAREGARTLLFVTADHGRASDFKNHGREHPESARVWLFAWGTEVSTKHLGVFGTRHLADLAPTLRPLFGLPEDGDPFAGRPIAGLLEGGPG
ncbi:MAG TPA: alkaline phosphatase family protein [Polyangiaceae bacterium]